MQFFHMEGLAKKWKEIHNYKVFLDTIKLVLKYLNNPMRYKLNHINYLAKQFNYSDDLIILNEALFIFQSFLREEELVEALLPLTRELSDNIIYDNLYYSVESESD